ncbi:MAG TPA: tRNA 2-thiouridine(34) synthase MnmA [Lachnospiraceae bacterium]|nr:tRNA 2-thiouridine(34) synthase MnmA [Lachnospiraceae bacterium]
MAKVVVGMSGGVDSSVAAYLLKKQGYDVIGVTMQIWQDESETAQQENGGCCGLSAVEDARHVAERLEIPYYVMNFKDIFRKKVMDYFVCEYRAGRTPNPCIACNRYVKWESLLEKSLAIGADYIATGHYAKVVHLDSGRYTLHVSSDKDGRSKDQTYALYNLTQDQLAHTLMPIGDYTKDEVRAIAEEAGLPVAHKPDSEEICFVPDGDYASFIENDTGIRDVPGNFVDTEGKVLGEHRGITHYTVGQRKHLGIALGYPVFVKEIRPDKNEVVLAGNENLFTHTLLAGDLNFMSQPGIPGKEEVWAKIRYNHRGASAIIEMAGEDRVRCTFREAVRAVTPGQSVVFYQKDEILGGGTIL